MMQSLVLQYALSSLRSGLLVLVVLLVCSLLRRLHTPSRYLCWVWLAVGVRFVLPGIPLTLPRRTGAALSKTADAIRAFSTASEAADPSAVETITEVQPPAVTSPYHVADTVAAPAAVPWYDRLTVWHFLAVLWAAVVCILILRTVIGYLRLSRKMALAYRTHDGAYTCAAVRTPFTMGLLRPRIYLPPDLTGSARRHVLAHEATHIRRGDTITKPLFYLIACLHWFNPLVWLAYRQFLRVMECACDEVAVQGLPEERRADYCKVILHFATVQGQPTPGSLSFGRGSTKERVKRVMRYRRPGRGRLTVCAAAVLLTMTACMVQPTAAGGAPQAADPTAPAPGSDAEAGSGTDAADDTAEKGPVIYYDIQALPTSEKEPASEIGSAGRRNLEWGKDNWHLDISTRRYDETGQVAVFKQTPFTTAKSWDDFNEKAAPCYDAYVWDTDHYLAAGIPDEDPGAGSLVFYETFDDGANWRETALDVAPQIGTAVIEGVELGNYDTGALWCAVTTDQDRLYVYERTDEDSWRFVTEFENTYEPGWYEHVWMISPTQGWATIDARYSRTPWLFVTTDGRNWEQVTVRDKETGQTPPINFLAGIGRSGDTLMLTADYDPTPGEMGGEFHSLFSTDNGKTWHMDWPLTGWPATEQEIG